MIRRWEVLPRPSADDPRRVRLSLEAEPDDVERLRRNFPRRAGTVWTPRRKPFNHSFFLYGLSERERLELEDLLEGREKPGPAAAPQRLEAAPIDIFKVPDLEPARAPEPQLDPEAEAPRATLDYVTPALTHLRIGYFCPLHAPEIGRKVHDLLIQISRSSHIQFDLSKAFELLYKSYDAAEVQRLIDHCRKLSIKNVIAVGDVTFMYNIENHCRSAGILAKLVDEDLTRKTPWLNILAEFFSNE